MFNRTAAKREMEETIENNEYYGSYTIVKVSNKSNEILIDWIEDGSEFLLNNVMYDVVTKRVSKDSTTYYCIKDEKETSINQKEVEYTKKENSTPQNVKYSSQKAVKKYFQEFTPIITPPISSEYFGFSEQKHYQSIPHDVALPPPKLS